MSKTTSQHLYFENDQERVKAVNVVDDKIGWTLNPGSCLTLTGTGSKIQTVVDTLKKKGFRFEWRETFRDNVKETPPIPANVKTYDVTITLKVETTLKPVITESVGIVGFKDAIGREFKVRPVIETQTIDGVAYDTPAGLASHGIEIASIEEVNIEDA